MAANGILSLENISNNFENNIENFSSRELFSQESINKDKIEDIKSNKIAIYTVAIGENCILNDPEFVDENCDYICFTDNNNLKSSIWKVINIEDSFLDDYRKTSKYIVFPHKYLPEYKYSLFINSNFKIKASLRDFIYNNITSSIICVIQPDSDCIFSKSYYSLGFNKFNNSVVNKQLREYFADKFPKNYGMVSSDVIFREHNDSQVIKVMEDCWEEIIDYLTPIQISLIYSLWKNDFKVSSAKINLINNEFWQVEESYLADDDTRYLASEHLIELLQEDISQINTLSKEELSLLVQDINNLKLEADNLNYTKYKKLFTEIQLLNSKSWKLTESLRSFKK